MVVERDSNRLFLDNIFAIFTNVVACKMQSCALCTGLSNSSNILFEQLLFRVS